MTTSITYLALAMRTNSTVAGTNALITPDLLHATLGLADELFEYQMSQSWLNAVEELGDLCWFVALASKELMFDPFPGTEAFAKFNPNLPVLAEAIAEFVGVVKKAFAYGQVLDVTRLRWLLSAMVARIEAISHSKAERSLEELLASNIAKLAARYPDKFTAEAALHRSIKNESGALKLELGTML